MAEKPLVLTEHATRRYVVLNLTPDVIRETVRNGKRTRLGKRKTSATMHTKKRTVAVIFAEYPDHTTVVTIAKGARRK